MPIVGTAVLEISAAQTEWENTFHEGLACGKLRNLHVFCHVGL